MASLNQSQFAQLCQVSRTAVSKAVKETPPRIVVRSDGLIDTTDPVNLKYKADQEQRHKGEKPAAGEKTPRRPPSAPRAPKMPDVPTGEIPLGEGDEEPEEFGEDQGLGLLAAEKIALIKNRNAQTARHMMALAKEMKLVVDRSEVERHDAKVGEEIRRFITSARTINQRMRAKILAGAPEKETQAFLEDEMTAIAEDVKRVLEEV